MEGSVLFIIGERHIVIVEIRKKGKDGPETEEIYVGHFNKKYGIPQPEDLIKDENKIDLSVENSLELIIKRAMKLKGKFLCW